MNERIYLEMQGTLLRILIQIFLDPRCRIFLPEKQNFEYFFFISYFFSSFVCTVQTKLTQALDVVPLIKLSVTLAPFFMVLP